MIPRHLYRISPLILCFALGCRQPSQASAAPPVPSPQQLLDQVMLPQDQMTPALLESDGANILFANQEIALAQKNRGAAATGGPLSLAKAQEHRETANLALKIDQDRFQTQQDIMNLRVYTVPRFLQASQ